MSGSESDNGYSDFDSEDPGEEIALACDLLYRLKLPPTPSIHSEVQQLSIGGKKAAPVITCVAFCFSKQRCYYGLDTGDICFWPMQRNGAGAVRYVGSHKGPITCIHIPRKQDGELGGLILSGSVDGHIKIWDYQGKVIQRPTVLIQTLYGHTGTITGLFAYGQHIISSSTDRTIKAWKAVEGRGQLVYPWYDLQATVATLDGWVRSMSYDRSQEVGDHGTFYAVDEHGSIVRVVPEDAHDEEGKRAPSKGINFAVDVGPSIGGGAAQSVVRKVHDRGVLLVRYVAAWGVLLTLCYDNALRVYDADSGDIQHEWVNENRCLFTDLEVDTEFSEVLVGDKLGVLAIYSLKAGRLIATKRVAAGPIVRIVSVMTRQVYAVVCEREAGIWRVDHELTHNVLRGGHTRAVVALYACSGGSGAMPEEEDYRIFTASVDNTVRLWDPYDMACVRVLEERASEVSAMTFYEAWNILVTGHDSGDIRLWDLDTGAARTLKQHTNSVTSLTLALMRRNEELLISAGFDGMVVIWDIRSLRNEPPHMIAKFRAHGADPVKGSLAATLSNASRLSAAHTATPTPASLSGATPQGGGSTVPVFDFPPAGAPEGAASLMSARSDVASLVGSSLAEGGAAAGPGADQVLTTLALEPEVLVVRYDVVKRVVITAGNDRTIRVWSPSGYYLLGQHLGHTDAVSCLALDANLLFSGSEDTTIRIWDTVPASHTPPSAALSTPSSAGSGGKAGSEPPVLGFIGSAMKVLTGHTRCVTALDINPATGHLLSVSLDGSLRFWDYVAGTVLHKFTHHEEFRCMALRFDKCEVLVGTAQASVLRFPSPEPIQATPAPLAAATLTTVSHSGAVPVTGKPEQGTPSRASGRTASEAAGITAGLGKVGLSGDGRQQGAAGRGNSRPSSTSSSGRDTWRYGAGTIMLPKKGI